MYDKHDDSYFHIIIFLYLILITENKAVIHSDMAYSHVLTANSATYFISTIIKQPSNCDFLCPTLGMKTPKSKLINLQK